MQDFDAFDAYDAVREIFIRNGFKIFNLNWRYNRLFPAFLAVRPKTSDYQKESGTFWVKKRHDVDDSSACWVRVDAGRNKLIVGWQQPNRKVPEIDKEIDEKAGALIKRRPRLMGRFRQDRWNELIMLVEPKQRQEFSEQIYNARLS